MKYILKIIFIVLISVAFIAALHSCKRVTAPGVTTVEVSGITRTSAVSGGIVTDDGGLEVNSRGVCWGITQNPTIAYSKTMDGNGTGPFTSSISGLTANTKYFVRAYAFNSEGISYGNEISFATSPIVLATIETAGISSISTSGALCGVNIAFDGGGLIIERGACWATHQNPTTDDDRTLDGTGAGSFTSDIKCLSFATTYFVRAYATNSAGTAYGDQQMFTTQGTNPIKYNPDLTYGSVTDIDGNCYKTIQIGTQTWMAENLKVTQYRNGTSVEVMWYNNDPSTYKDSYGSLYNWAPVLSDKICPIGWHVPSNSEWQTLTTFLGGENVAGGKLKEAGTTHWTSPNTDADNKSGFTALPGGKRKDEYFKDLASYGNWWSRTPKNTGLVPYCACSQQLAYDQTSFYGSYEFKSSGLSIRCLKNVGPDLTTDSATNFIIAIHDPWVENYVLTLISGGHDINDNGSAITHKGTCWNYQGNPEISDQYTDEGSGSGSFKSTISFGSHFIYPHGIHIRAYATNGNGTGYGNEITLYMRDFE